MISEPKAVLQADLLYLPDDKGYKYALVCVDVGSGYIDAEQLKERDATTVLNAYKKITNFCTTKRMSPLYTADRQRERVSWCICHLYQKAGCLSTLR